LLSKKQQEQASVESAGPKEFFGKSGSLTDNRLIVTQNETKQETIAKIQSGKPAALAHRVWRQEDSV
jgi:hypothetical protein